MAGSAAWLYFPLNVFSLWGFMTGSASLFFLIWVLSLSSMTNSALGVRGSAIPRSKYQPSKSARTREGFVPAFSMPKSGPSLCLVGCIHPRKHFILTWIVPRHTRGWATPGVAVGTAHALCRVAPILTSAVRLIWYTGLTDLLVWPHACLC